MVCLFFPPDALSVGETLIFNVISIIMFYKPVRYQFLDSHKHST